MKFNTLQEVFQYSVEKLAEQAQPAKISYFSHCFYFLDTDDGRELRCAIGHIMPDYMKPPLSGRVMDIKSVMSVAKKHSIVGKWAEEIKNVYDEKAFEALQIFHDNPETWSSKDIFLVKVKELFLRFGLTLDEDKLDFSNWRQDES